MIYVLKKELLLALLCITSLTHTTERVIDKPKPVITPKMTVGLGIGFAVLAKAAYNRFCRYQTSCEAHTHYKSLENNLQNKFKQISSNESIKTLAVKYNAADIDQDEIANSSLVQKIDSVGFERLEQEVRTGRCDSFNLQDVQQCKKYTENSMIA